MLALLLLVLVWCGAAPLPSAEDYANIYAMESRKLIPYIYPVLPPKSNEQIIANGKKFFGNISSSQNSTALSLVVYDWSQPHYHRVQALQSYLIDQNDPEGLAKFVFNNVLLVMFGFQPARGESESDFVARFLSQIDVVKTYLSEITLLNYALSVLPEPQTAPVYSGICPRDDYCREIGIYQNISSTACMQKYFVPGLNITNAIFWSTSLDLQYASNYACGYILQISSPSHIAGRNISQMAIAGRERLYPAGTTFEIQSVVQKSDTTWILMNEM
jgi:hypothetical protein